jgi:aryl-alcohol dehydrogenase-like predicted oxidoreductase
MGFTPVESEARERIAIMQAAIDAGITSIDTAPMYGFGGVEKLVGEAIAGRRDSVQILTKVGIDWEGPRGQILFEFDDQHGQRRAARRNSRPEHVRKEVDQSLSRLGVDVIDLAQVHHPDLETPIPETMGALLELKQAGKLRAIGVSNYTAEQMRIAQAALGDTPLACNQVSYSLLERSIEASVLPLARQTGCGILAYSPLAQGMLGGAHHKRPAPTDWRGGGAPFHPKNRVPIAQVIDGVMEPIATARGVSLAEIALAFLLAQPGMSAVIVGASSVAQARRNAAAGDLALSQHELDALRSSFEALHIDPNAGQDLLSRITERAKRAAGKIERLVRRLDLGI